MTVAVAAVATRLRREDVRRTKHDSAFSPWKILIGESDWEDHLRGREGAERYRTQNLPNWISCSGIYELGIATTQSGKGDRKLHSNSVICVYLGQADNLRTRLQRYGRDGAHLESGRWPSDKSSHSQTDKSPRLFTDIFSRGLPIVYRCAPMASKRDAEKTEKQLLEKFDYAWNKGNNGARRIDDIYKKLDSLKEASKVSLLVKRLADSLKWKKAGIRIKASSQQANSINIGKTRNVSRIFGIRRVQQNVFHDPSSTDICGVAIGSGSVCKAQPVHGRKRCPMHKGMRVHGYISKLALDEESDSGAVPPDSQSLCLAEEEFVMERRWSMSKERCREHKGDACGLLLEVGAYCQKKAVERNKRCSEHKGMRTRRTKA